MHFKNATAKIVTIIIVVLLALTVIIFVSFMSAFNDVINSLSAAESVVLIGIKTIFLRNLVIGQFLFISIAAIIILIGVRLELAKLESEMKKQKSLIETQKNEIAHLQELKDNLAGLYNNAVEYDKMKTDFFSNIIHDLKTPLSVIIGAIQLINKKHSDHSDDKSSLERNLKIINQNVYMLLKLLNNILEITRISSGYVKTNMNNCNIVYIVEEITQSISPYSESKGLNLVFDTDVEEVITAIDIDKMEKVMLNLLSNAIKFTPPGGDVTVYVKEENNKVYISVKDTGPGIPKEKQDIIFERYKHVDSNLTRENEGSGIGLSIAKSYVELHCGKLTVKSEENKGSEFIVELPIRTINGKAQDDYKEINPHDKIIEAINIEFSDIYHIA
ncbi:HAMP domain-containing sensor histidine kinase [Pseudoclostridium thermosuccinogenes]|jgi:signal transduction histidine kinase|uniref:sensor histidine kinase n=1 Tax=Clostridium thermosuccinogenes TaxID=84032 RepID=UPI002FDA9F2E